MKFVDYKNIFGMLETEVSKKTMRIESNLLKKRIPVCYKNSHLCLTYSVTIATTRSKFGRLIHIFLLLISCDFFIMNCYFWAPLILEFLLFASNYDYRIDDSNKSGQVILIIFSSKYYCIWHENVTLLTNYSV